MNGIKTIKKNLGQSGLMLIEIMVAFGIFAAFYIVFIGSQSDNVIDSRLMEEELKLHGLCENVINDILFSPPPLNLALTLRPETSRFEDSDLADFEYTVEYKQFELPNFFEIFQEQTSEDGQQNNPQMKYLNILFNQIKGNIKKALWQVRVTVKNKVSGSNFTLSSWIRNPNYEIEAQFGGGGAPPQSPGSGGTQ